MRARPTVDHYAVGLYRVSTAEQGQSGLGLRRSRPVRGLSRRPRAGRRWPSTRTSPAARTTGIQASRRLSRVAANSGRCWWPHGLIRSPAGRTRFAVVGRRPLGPHGRHAGCGRPDDAGVRRDGAEGARVDQPADPGGLAAAKARGTVLGGDRGYRPSAGPDASVAASARRDEA